MMSNTKMGQEGVEVQQYQLRELECDDFDRGFLRLLERLTGTVAQTIPRAAFEQRLALRNLRNVRTFVMVTGPGGGGQSHQNQKVVATASLVLEDKFLRKLSRVGHIEDVVVLSNVSGQGVGKRLVKHLVQEALQVHGCYKVVLNCSSNNAGFYNKCGFSKRDEGMAIYAAADADAEKQSKT